jgi:glycosyltransferase involved in cell wall biosynthesis
VTGRRAVLVVPEIPTPPRSGNAWRDLQQLSVLGQLGFSVHVLAARRRWDLSDDEEAAGARLHDGGVSYLTETREEPDERLVARVMRKVGYVLGVGRHPFGWWLPGTLAERLRALARDAQPSDVALIRSIFIHDIPRLRGVWPGRIVVDCHDSDVHLAGELLATVRGAARLGPWANLRGVRRAVARFLPQADEVWAVSAEDATRLAAEASGARLVVVPSGMDERHAAMAPNPGIDGTALLVANFGYGPNARGTEWLLRSVWPDVRRRIPTAALWLVGGRLPHGLAQLAAARPGVEVMGQVADLAPLLRDAAVVVAPLLEGGGTRLKIVEAWSQGKAVVTTTKGIEGLPRSESAVAVVDAAPAFADRLHELLTDAARRRTMGAAALALFRQRLSWEVARQAVATGSIVARADREPERRRVAT